MYGAKLFRSRWTALIWAAGILWTAYDVAEATKGDAPPQSAQQAAVHRQHQHQDAAPTPDLAGTDVSQKDLDILANMAGG